MELATKCLRVRKELKIAEANKKKIAPKNKQTNKQTNKNNEKKTKNQKKKKRSDQHASTLQQALASKYRGSSGASWKPFTK
jgi:hypothetical protein